MNKPAKTPGQPGRIRSRQSTPACRTKPIITSKPDKAPGQNTVPLPPFCHRSCDIGLDWMTNTILEHGILYTGVPPEFLIGLETLPICVPVVAWALNLSTALDAPLEYAEVKFVPVSSKTVPRGTDPVTLSQLLGHEATKQEAIDYWNATLTYSGRRYTGKFMSDFVQDDVLLLCEAGYPTTYLLLHYGWADGPACEVLRFQTDSPREQVVEDIAEYAKRVNDDPGEFGLPSRLY